MRFSYASYEVDPSPTNPIGILCRPEIPIDVIGALGAESVQALVDTGSDETVFPLSLAEAIGVRLDREQIGSASAVGGHIVQLVPGRVTLEMSDGNDVIRWTTTVSFLKTAGGDDEIALLGFSGFLEFFRAVFDSQLQELELTPNSTFADRSATGS
jgi:predicted aspartyl protease